MWRRMLHSGGGSGANLRGSASSRGSDHATAAAAQATATTTRPNSAKRILSHRKELADSKRIVVKLGSAVITRGDECGLALGRLASIVEQVSRLHNSGKELTVVTSGAVAFGKQRMRQEKALSRSIRQTLQPEAEGLQDVEPRACAAAGQVGLMGLYETMFAQYGVTCAQVLLTGQELQSRGSLSSLLNTMDALLRMKVIPVLNGNDVLAPDPSMDSDLQNVLSIPDNDQLSAQVARSMGADLLILLSDVEGIYTGHPSQSASRLIRTYYPEHSTDVQFWGKSRVGKGGMESKLKSAVEAVEGNTAVVIANGTSQRDTILDIVAGKPIGTLITRNGHGALVSPASVLVDEARAGSSVLQRLSSEQRAEILRRLAQLLSERKTEILEANSQDLNAATSLSPSLRARLELTEEKLKSLASGLEQLAVLITRDDPIGEVLNKTLVAHNLELVQQRVPMGVLLVIFESRPDCLPQVSGLAIATGNGMLLKGGSEAQSTNRCLHSLVREALELHAPPSAIGLVDTREEVSELVSCEKIDLVIPRGSNQLVESIMSQAGGRVPVLGHSEGICHVYIDSKADIKKAVKIVVDSKCDYPAACNAMETLLLHADLLTDYRFQAIISALREKKVVLHPGPRLAAAMPVDMASVSNMDREYSGLECSVELVDGVQEAVAHVNTHGSGHTDCIVTEDSFAVREFEAGVDSACVFHNASTRFSDGYRFGLGAEVGISTGKVHARGPVGMKGLTTTKWLLRGQGQGVRDFVPGAEGGSESYLHKNLLQEGDQEAGIESESERQLSEVYDN